MKNPLFSSEIDGNTLNLNQDEGVSHRDLCRVCGAYDDEHHCLECDEIISKKTCHAHEGICIQCEWLSHKM